MIKAAIKNLVTKKRKAIISLLGTLFLISFIVKSGSDRFTFNKRRAKEKSATKNTPIPSTEWRTPKDYVQFEIIRPFVQPFLSPNQTSLYLAVVVNSAAKGEEHRKLRQTIRQTWGKPTKSQLGRTTRPWKLFFSLGIVNNSAEHEANLKEAHEHNDVIIGDFKDTYRNVVIKTFMAHFWAITKLSCNYVLKTDDDVYVRVPGLISWLIKSGSPKRFYGGRIAASNSSVVNRDPNNLWYISREQYNGTLFPPWCHGMYHVISNDIIPSLLFYTNNRKPFHTDDAYIGVAFKDLGVRAIQIPGFTMEHFRPRRRRSDKELLQAIAIGHKLDIEQIKNFHEFYVANKLT